VLPQKNKALATMPVEAREGKKNKRRRKSKGGYYIRAVAKK
jgi:hypothetical protein